MLVVDENGLAVTSHVDVKTHAPYRLPLEPADDLPYQGYLVVGTRWDGAKAPFYPLFPQDRAWILLSRDGTSLDSPDHAVHEQHRFGMTAPTLAWQNGTQRMELYVDGLTHGEFLTRYGLDVQITKNGFITSKRMSRMLRDYRMYERLPTGEVTVEYLDLDEAGEKIWDGSGLISRRMLERLQLSPNLAETSREHLRAELKTAGRVEFTLVNGAGQHKGHALVVDDLEVDFLLPRDIKKDVRTTDGTAFIGVNAVHSQDHLRLDIQSIMNLHPFISHETMLDYLQQQETLFHEAVESGQKGAAMARLDHATRDDLTSWPLRHFFARGGDARWFPGMVKEFYNSAIQSVEHSLEKGKLRVPLPGGRYYVMTSDVALAAKHDITLERGQIHLDPTTNTAWVHRDDWLHLPDSASDHPMGIRDILGGADQDDALWVHGFTDYDGERKVLAWRSPNNTGEYVILKPGAMSNPMLWHTPAGETISYPSADSRHLIPRIDQLKSQRRTTYEHLAQAPQPGELGQGQAYSPAVMDLVNQRTLENAGILGGYCNYTLGYKGVTGSVPSHLPDTLEAVIDNDVKNGGSNALVGARIQELTRDFLASGTAIPEFLAPRFGIYRDAAGQLPRTQRFGDQSIAIRTTEDSHWVDQLAYGVQHHIQRLSERRNELMRTARLPNAVHDSVAGDAEALAAGAKFNQTYYTASQAAREKYQPLVTANPQTQRSLYEKQLKKRQDLIFAYVRDQCETFLQQHAEERHTAILRGAMVSRETSIKRSSGKKGRASLYDDLGISSDAALWQRGLIAETSLRALQEVGLLGEIVEETNVHGRRLVKYPTPQQTAHQATYESVRINKVWYNRAQSAAQSRGETLPPVTQMDTATQTQHKQNVRFLASRTHEQGGFLGLRLFVNERYLGENTTQKRLVFEDERGHIFGLIDKTAQDQWREGDEAIVRQAKADHDGNLVTRIERL